MAQAPKLMDHILAMRQRLREDLQVALKQISVKATTTEKLGFVGQRQGVAVHAITLLLSD